MWVVRHLDKTVCSIIPNGYLVSQIHGVSTRTHAQCMGRTIASHMTGSTLTVQSYVDIVAMVSIIMTALGLKACVAKYYSTAHPLAYFTN